MQRTATLCLLAQVLVFPLTAQPGTFANFETAQTHPVAVSADGLRLFAVNTPDHRLAVFSLVRPDAPVLLYEVPVGLEPVSVRPRTADEVWVVNRLGDSISVVSLTQRRVLATLRVSDEPADVAFAGNPQVAVVSVSGSDEVRFFGTTSHQPLGELALFGDEPRAIAVSPNGDRVFVAIHRSGNRTTAVPENLAPRQPPPTNPQLPAPPRTSLLVDSTDPRWTSAHGLVLPDHDVFEIDPDTRTILRSYAGLGTSLFDLAVHPTTGDVWVANTDARNLIRFEPNLRGHIIDSRVTRFTPGAAPAPAFFDLNAGLDYSILPNPAASASALSQPTGLAFDAAGNELWVAAFGTDRVGVVDGAGQVQAFVELGVAGAGTDPRNKRGPRGLAMHPSAGRLYVLNRLSNTIAVIDAAARALLTELPVGYDPTPAHIAEGRGFLYDAKLSGNGTASCAACHVDGEIDGIGWDLGDPGGEIIRVPLFGKIPLFADMHPMKGPMVTQTLRGLTPDTAPFHWRGDRPRLQAFNGAFDSLMGADELSQEDMDAYAAFMETLAFPPNPNLNRNRTLPTRPRGTSPQEGFNFYTTQPFIQGLTCNDCHAVPTGTNTAIIPSILLQESQSFKVPQLRNAYKRLGRRKTGGMSKSGFGLLHDGTNDDVFDLLSRPVFGALSTQPTNKRKLENFVLAFDTGVAPAVGYGVSVDQQNATSPATLDDTGLLRAQALADNCDLVARGSFQGRLRGFTYDRGTDTFVADEQGIGPFTLAQLLTEIGNGNAALTFSGVPRGEGTRIGIDRDADGTLDGDEWPVAYGQPTPPCATPLRLDASSEPRLNNALFSLVVEGAPANQPGFLLLGAQATSIPLLDVTVLVDLTVALALPLGADPLGVAALPLPVPGRGNLAGQSLVAQAGFGAGCGQLGVALSNGLTVTFGQ